MPETRPRNGASRIEQTKGGASFMLAKVCKAHRAKVGALLAGHGLHVGQEMVLLELCRKTGCAVGSSRYASVSSRPPLPRCYGDSRRAA